MSCFLGIATMGITMGDGRDSFWEEKWVEGVEQFCSLAVAATSDWEFMMLSVSSLGFVKLDPATPWTSVY